MDSNQHIDNVLSNIRSIFVKAQERIDALKPGEKIPATKLAEDIAKEIDMTGSTLYPTLKFLFDGYPGIDVKRGAHGGLVKHKLTEVPEGNSVLDSVINEDNNGN
jgi:hypothetical protein